MESFVWLPEYGLIMDVIIHILSSGWRQTLKVLDSPSISDLIPVTKQEFPSFYSLSQALFLRFKTYEYQKVTMTQVHS